MDRHTCVSDRRCSDVEARLSASVRVQRSRSSGGAMPGAMHRMGVYLGLVEDDEYTDADGDGQTTERAPARRDEYAEQRYPRESAHVEPSYGREYGEDK